MLLLYININAQIQQKNKESVPTTSIEAVVIEGPKSSQNKPLQLSRNRLDVIQGNNLGETLSKISGIQNYSFGGNAGTPMIRSLAGNRVKLLNNGLSMNDFSGISPYLTLDYDPENVKAMQVYKGTAAVMYGGKAIGGAVNIFTGTIPNSRFDKNTNAQLKLEGSSNNGFRQNITVEGNLGKRFAWHTGAMNEDRDIVRVNGNSKSGLCYDPSVVGFDTVMQALCQVKVNSEHVLNVTIFPYLNQFVLDHLDDPNYGLSPDDVYTFNPKYFSNADFTYHDNPKNPKFVAGQDPIKDRYKDEVRSVEDVKKGRKGRIPNSHYERRSVNAGLSYIGNKFYTGIGYQGDYAYFGIPAYAQNAAPKHTHGTPVAEPEWDPVNIGLTSHRAMAEAGATFDDFFIKNIKLSYDAQLSENVEFLGQKIANKFDVTQHSAKLELVQKPWSFLSGTAGIDFDHRKILGYGRLRYLPNTQSRDIGFYTLQHLKYKFAEADLGYRNDQVLRMVMPDKKYVPGRGLAGGNFTERNLGLNHFSALLKLNVLKFGYLTGKYTHSERAPEVNELYAGNRHFAIITEENGDDMLKKETANTMEAGLAVSLKNLHVTVNYYDTKYKDYIYLAHTGIVRDGFVVKEWRNADTELRGWEGDAVYRIRLPKDAYLDVSGFYDIVKNINVSDNEIRRWADGDYMPNMPVSRVGAGLAGKFGALSFTTRLERYLKQRYLGKNINKEIAMEPFSMLSCHISYSADAGAFKNEYYIFGTNLLNVAGRAQNSPMKYVVPVPGINIGAGVKIKL